MAHDVLGGDLGGFLVAGEVAEMAQALGDGGAEAGLVGAAFGGRDRVAVGAGEAVLFAEAGLGPGDGPFAFAVMAHVDEAGEGRFRDRGLVVEDFVQLVGEAVGVGEDGVGGDFRIFG